MEVFFDPIVLVTMNLMVIAGEMYVREHMQEKILATQAALTDRITILEGQIKNFAAVKPTIDTTTGTITLNETTSLSRFFHLQDTDTTMSVYVEMAFVVMVGVLSYVIYVKDQENKLLSNMAVAQAHEIGSLRLDLQKADHAVATYKTQIESHKKAAQTTNALAAEYKKAGDEHKAAAAAAAQSAADLAAKAADDRAVDQVLAFNELVNLVKDKCVETDNLVAASKVDNEGVKKLFGELNAVLPRLQADAYQRGKDDCRSEILDEFGLKGMA